MGPASSVRRSQTDHSDDEELERKRRASEALEKYAKEYTAARGGKMRQKSGAKDTLAGGTSRAGSRESSAAAARDSKSTK